MSKAMEENNVSERLDNHEQRINQLETNYGMVMDKIADMEKGQLDLQNTVLKEFSSTKDMLNEQNKLNSTLLEQMYGIKTLRITTRKDIWLGLLGGSGIVGVLSLIISQWQHILKIFGG
ncbi:hypothetical protein [Metabacillus halosaccharovorans]|uniref:Uncharacterized protein n=1 Tax=Metabacillus halosaccharovorans TaxID=930124 RepID=A0ABT3DGP3_9BACI|nr:hypothetical protein [Metabacillus halosaccharovorans]MCV9886230.1 hypothetical protein [Metabacillus halosaccharovorans]